MALGQVCAILWAGAGSGADAKSREKGCALLPKEVLRMEKHLDLEYARVGDRSLYLDLYLPDERSRPLPLIVYIHGGAWRAGSKAHPRALRYVSEGFAVASVGYRLSQEAIFPAQIHDCKAAVRWLRAHAKTYGLDVRRLAAWGESAGAHLAALLGVSAACRSLEGALGNPDQSSAVNAVCSWFGPSDFLRMNDSPGVQDHNAPIPRSQKLIGAPLIQTRPDLVARANPVTYVREGAPPFLLMHGTADEVVIPGQSEFARCFGQAAGVRSTLILLGRTGSRLPR